MDPRAEPRTRLTDKKAPKPRKPASITEAIRDLREKISTQQLIPGSRVLEQEVAKSYKIPRAKAREVLAALEDRGLIEREPNKGAIVSPVDMETTYRLYEVREVLDGLTVRLAAERSRPEDWADIQELFGDLFESSLRAGDLDTHIGIIEKFRNRIRIVADSNVLSDMLDRVYDRSRVTMRRVALLPGRAELGMKQYRSVLEAIVRGDGEEAERRVRELNRSARDYITRFKNYVL